MRYLVMFEDYVSLNFKIIRIPRINGTRNDNNEIVGKGGFMRIHFTILR